MRGINQIKMENLKMYFNTLSTVDQIKEEFSSYKVPRVGERRMMEERIEEVIYFLRNKANEANALHEKYTKEYEIWCRTGKGKKPIPPAALPIAAQYMRNAAKSLEEVVQDFRVIRAQNGRKVE
jgi:hypothetical protein